MSFGPSAMRERVNQLSPSDQIIAEWGIKQGSELSGELAKEASNILSEETGIEIDPKVAEAVGHSIWDAALNWAANLRKPSTEPTPQYTPSKQVISGSMPPKGMVPDYGGGGGGRNRR